MSMKAGDVHTSNWVFCNQLEVSNMPNILVHVPKGSFSGNARSALVRRINDAAAKAEQIPGDPRKRMLCWVLVNEVDDGAWTCGGADLTAQMLPCLVMVYVPGGVLDDTSRASYVQCIHEALQASQPVEDKRPLATSVVLHEVEDGAWGANGAIWHLPHFAKAAGFAHLQHLVTA
jgi:phenylpyruvate tautomerase PptA (4-oxalocrotonate tautomerase family)